MVTPNIWGHGQLFAFSALDGNSLMSDDFTGILCADKIGIRFFSKTRRELIITKKGQFVPEFETVTSDLITVNTISGQVNILYADTHLIIGNTTDSTDVVVTVEGDYIPACIDGIQIHRFADDLIALEGNLETVIIIGAENCLVHSIGIKIVIDAAQSHL